MKGGEWIARRSGQRSFDKARVWTPILECIMDKHFHCHAGGIAADLRLTSGACFGDR